MIHDIDSQFGWEMAMDIDSKLKEESCMQITKMGLKWMEGKGSVCLENDKWW